MLVARLIRFRKEIVTLWHAFWNPLTPTYLKVLTILVTFYVISPIDIITDIIPVLGWVDDVIIVSFAVSWIVSRLPRKIWETSQPHPKSSPSAQKTISGTARRL